MERFSRTPHDAIFRQMLAQKEVARDFLQLYLPAQFLSICDLSTLQLASGSFIEEDPALQLLGYTLLSANAARRRIYLCAD